MSIILAVISAYSANVCIIGFFMSFIIQSFPAGKHPPSATPLPQLYFYKSNFRLYPDCPYVQPHFWLKEVQSRRCRKKLPVLEQYRIWYKILKILVVTTRYMVYNRARDVGPSRRIRRELSAAPGIFAMAAQKETQRLWNRPIITAKGRTSMQFWTLPRPSRGERSGRVWRGSDRIFRGRNMNWKSFPINSEAFESPG